jgi:hypothetical protein
MSEGPDWTNRILDHSGLFVKRDRPARELILKTCISAYSDNPLNLFLEGPPSIGKTNAVKHVVVPYFPRRDVMLLGALSPTALVHDYGTLIDTRTGLEVDPDKKPTKENFTTGQGKEKVVDKRGYVQAQKEWRETLRNAAYLVNLKRKILVFLEAPHYETFARLRPVLSHDVPEISYKFTDKTKSGLRTVTTILRGWPATIFLTTEVKHTGELSSRSLATTPEMTEEKYHEANRLSGDITSRPWRYSTKNDPEMKVIADHIFQVAEASKRVDGVVVPYGDKVGDLFPCKVPSDMRHCPHFLSLIKQNALLNMFDRPVIVKDEEVYLLANLKDLEATIPLYSSIAEATSLQVPKHILDFYNGVFLKVEKDVCSLKDDDPEFGRITVARLVAKHNVTSQSKPSSASVYVYLKTLKEKAIIDSKTDPIDRRHQIYFSITQRINSLDFISKESSSFFRETELENWLKSEANYLTIKGVDKFLFSPSLGHLDKGDPTTNLLDRKTTYSPIFVRYFGTVTGLENSLKTENNPKDTLLHESKTKYGV